MVAVLNSSLARSSRVALAALVVGHAGVVRQQQRRLDPQSPATPRCTQNYDIAVAEYTKLLRDNPNNRDARQGLERAKLRASQDHFTTARRLAATGKLEEALVEYQLAAELNPGNADIERELQDTRTQLRAKVAIREDGKTRLESLIAQSLAAPLPGADLPADAKLPDSVVFRDASARDVYSAIGKFTNLSVVFDPTFRDQPVSIDLRGQSLERGAERAVARRRATSGASPRRARSPSCPTPPPSGASTKKRSSARST